jgi:chemotaxis protein methyltransferase CheR
MKIGGAEFEYVQFLVHAHCGVRIDPDRAYLAESRLGPIAAAQAFGSFEALVTQLRCTPRGVLHDSVVEAMLTTETSFFRDAALFAALRDHLMPELLASSIRPVRVWCAACASGQEPYSLAMLSRSLDPPSAASVEILASDVSEAMLARTKAALYGTLEVNRGLPASLLVQNFDHEGAHWRVKAPLREMVALRRINLVHDAESAATALFGAVRENAHAGSIQHASWPDTVDVMLLRNVLIYFDTETKQRVLTRAARVIRPNGYLVLGSAETLVGLDVPFDAVHFQKCVIYRRRSAPDASLRR